MGNSVCSSKKNSKIATLEDNSNTCITEFSDNFTVSEPKDVIIECNPGDICVESTLAQQFTYSVKAFGKRNKPNCRPDIHLDISDPKLIKLSVKQLIPDPDTKVFVSATIPYGSQNSVKLISVDGKIEKKPGFACTQYDATIIKSPLKN